MASKLNKADLYKAYKELHKENLKLQLFTFSNETLDVNKVMDDLSNDTGYDDWYLENEGCFVDYIKHLEEENVKWEHATCNQCDNYLEENEKLKEENKSQEEIIKSNHTYQKFCEDTNTEFKMEISKLKEEIKMLHQVIATYKEENEELKKSDVNLKTIMKLNKILGESEGDMIKMVTEINSLKEENEKLKSLF